MTSQGKAVPYFISTFLFCFLGISALAQIVAPVQRLNGDSTETSFFPYSEDDILVYSVFEFSGSYIEDSKIVIVKDSLDGNGARYLSLDSEGFPPIASAFKIDSSLNIYGNEWWDHRSWKIFSSNGILNRPWIAFKYEEVFELAIIQDSSITETFGVSDTILGIEFYMNTDSTAIDGLQRNYADWSKKFGVTYKFDFEGGPIYLLKGVVKDGQVFGDTSFYQAPPPNTVQKNYFPYQDGDILVFEVKDSLGNALPDNKVTLIEDSTDGHGTRWFSVESTGFDPIIKGFGVDTSRNIYGLGWWENNSEPWKIYDAFNSNAIPWVAVKEGDSFILGGTYTIEQRFVFGKNFGINIINDVYVVNYYLSVGVLTPFHEISESNYRNHAEWTREFGIFYKKDYQTGVEYLLKGGVFNGQLVGDTATVITSNELEVGTPISIRLSQNYPNPFNPRTSINFVIPSRLDVSLRIFDLLGREVAVLVNEVKESGEYAINFDASSLSSGVYIYQLSINGEAITKRMTLIK